jgi:hypothetical protein
MSGIANGAPWKTIEVVRYDWHADGQEYEFVLLVPSVYDAGGDFTRLDIARYGKVVYTLTDSDGLTKYNDDWIDGNWLFRKKNILKSKYLLMVPGIKGNSNYPLLLLFGWSYASSPGSLHIVALGNDGIPKDILNLTNFDITRFADLNQDSIPELIGNKCLSQSWGPDYDFLTYDPYSVYRFGSGATSQMVFDIKLTESFNRQNYYGWAGPECSEDKAIVLHPPGGGKPLLLDADKAKNLFSK